MSLVTLGVNNLERAAAFYRDGLGLPSHEGDSGVAFSCLRGFWLALFSRDALAAVYHRHVAASIVTPKRLHHLS